MASVGEIADALRADEDDVRFLGALGADERAVLLGAIREAADARDRELQEAVAGALRFVPGPLRGRIVALLGGRRG